MTNHNIKNLPASVKSRLLNIARNTQKPFQELLQYYVMERFLFRLSESRYKDIFILKGALLFKVWGISDSRATMDIDTLARTSNSLNNLIKIIKEICAHIPSVADGVEFLPSSINGEKMQLQKEYEGIRILFEGRLASSKIPMQIDIGFGDIITPAVQQARYPNILNFPAPQLNIYIPETLIAEKIVTMIEKGETNSRIKDFYDVWLLFRKNDLNDLFSYKTVKQALIRTARFRKIEYDTQAFSSSIALYAKNPNAHTLWERFKKKQLPELHQNLLLDVITNTIIGILRQIEDGNINKTLSSILQPMI